MLVRLLRHLVSGDKKRYIANGFDLDLTYITPRILAMALPASGFHAIYRNNEQHVAQFMNTRHADRYLVCFCLFTPAKKVWLLFVSIIPRRGVRFPCVPLPDRVLPAFTRLFS